MKKLMHNDSTLKKELHFDGESTATLYKEMYGKMCPIASVIITSDNKRGVTGYTYNFTGRQTKLSFLRPDWVELKE